MLNHITLNQHRIQKDWIRPGVVIGQAQSFDKEQRGNLQLYKKNHPPSLAGCGTESFSLRNWARNWNSPNIRSLWKATKFGNMKSSPKTRNRKTDAEKEIWCLGMCRQRGPPRACSLLSSCKKGRCTTRIIQFFTGP